MARKLKSKGRRFEMVLDNKSGGFTFVIDEASLVFDRKSKSVTLTAPKITISSEQIVLNAGGKKLRIADIPTSTHRHRISHSQCGIRDCITEPPTPGT
jgi:hypothetical protein